MIAGPYIEVRRFNFFPQTLNPKRSLIVCVKRTRKFADARMATSHWGDLLEDLFLRVLDCFDYRERYILGLAKLCASSLNSIIKTQKPFKKHSRITKLWNARQIQTKTPAWNPRRKVEVCMHRVRDTVLVCKRWSTLCLENPPHHAKLVIQLQNTTTPSYLTWLAQSSRRAEKLGIIINSKSSEEGYPRCPSTA